MESGDKSNIRGVRVTDTQVNSLNLSMKYNKSLFKGMVNHSKL